MSSDHAFSLRFKLGLLSPFYPLIHRRTLHPQTYMYQLDKDLQRDIVGGYLFLQSQRQVVERVGGPGGGGGGVRGHVRRSGRHDCLYMRMV